LAGGKKTVFGFIGTGREEGGSSPGGKFGPVPTGLLVLIWIGVFFLFGLLTVKTYPPVNYNLGDEIWAYQGGVDAIERGLPRQIITPRLFFLAMGRFLAFFGGGVFTARVFSLAAACFALYLTYMLGREMLHGKAGLFSSLLLGTAFAFSWHSRVVRPEMMTAAVMAAAFYLIYRGRSPGKERFLLYGSFLAALSVLVHPNNLQYVLAVFPLYFLLQRRRAFGMGALYFLGGLALGFLLWLFMNYSPSGGSSTPLEISARGVAGASAFPVLNRNFLELFFESLAALPRDYVQYVRLFDVYFPNKVAMAVPASAGAVICALSMFTRQRGGVLTLLFFVLATSFINYFVTARFGYWHMVEFYPFLSVAVVLGIFGLGDRMGTGAHRAFLTVSTFFFIALGVADTAATMSALRGYDYERFLGKVSEKVRGKAIGMDLYAPAFAREEFTAAWFSIDKPSTRCPSFESRVRELGVEYIIADELLQHFARMSCGPEYENEMARYLFLKCGPVARVEESYPNYWAKGGIISEIYILRPPRD
jgi:4-amino-4-deoxy-L-arabinose transferase-like glycosyltransferase